MNYADDEKNGDEGYTVDQLKPLLLLFVEAHSPAPSLLIAAFPDYPDAVIRETFSTLLDSGEVFFTKERKLSTKSNTTSAPVEHMQPEGDNLTGQEALLEAISILENIEEPTTVEKNILNLLLRSRIVHDKIGA